jgi:peroxiredoxin (alkyl hydroperoxide reductase subunit C)
MIYYGPRIAVAILIVIIFSSVSYAQDNGLIFAPGKLKPIDTDHHVKKGDKAPDFTLIATDGREITLSDYRGKKNVTLSFVPAAFTPVCSHQWPGYNITEEEIFHKNDTVVIGLSVDNIPTLYAWTEQMGELWFPVVSDFWPHGEVAKKYGVLRSDGMAERAIFVIDKKGVVQWAHIHDINKLPRIEELAKVLDSLN